MLLGQIIFTVPAPAQRTATAVVLRQLGLEDAGSIVSRLKTVNSQRLQEELSEDHTLYFSLLYLSYYGQAGRGIDSVQAILARQQADGFIPARFSKPRRPISPYLAQIALLSSKQRTHFTWLQDRPPGREGLYYERLKQYLDYWLTTADSDGNGLPAWSGNIFPQKENSAPVESVALACLLYRELKAMSGLAHQLRRREDIVFFQQRAKALAEKVNALLWNEEQGWYVDRDPSTGKHLEKSASGLLVLSAGIAPYHRAERLLHTQLLRGISRLDYAIVPSGKPMAADSAAQIWIPFNYLVFQGLMDYGYRDLARDLARESFFLLYRSPVPAGGYFHPVTGASTGPKTGACWPALAYFMPWECELNYSPATWSWQPLLRLAPDYLNIEWP